jgi:arylsulfatase A
MNKKNAVLVLFFVIGISLLSCKKEKDKPLNIVFFLVDDLGWSDVGCYGSEFYETPNIDKLAMLKTTPPNSA